MPPKARNAEDLSNLRLTSRQDYLAKRQDEQVQLLRLQVQEEEEEERTNLNLSRQEKEQFKKNRELLRLTESRLAIDDSRDGYILPDADYSSKADILSRRHNEKDHYVSEIQAWEQDQTSKVKAQIQTSSKVVEEDYEFVFDESTAIKWDVSAIDPNKQRLEQILNEAEKKTKDIKSTRESLPMFAYRDQLLAAVAEHQCLIIVGETGSGKTTQLTQYLHEAGYTKGDKKIGCTQPRRVAAMSVAMRVAEETFTKCGSLVGYRVRFESKEGPDTRILYMTDGMLLREMLTNPDLADYSAVVLDEAHERTVATDILMAILKDLCRIRPDFKLLISSATMDAQKFSKYFDDAPIFSIPGRMYPVENYYVMQPEADYLKAAIACVFQIHISQPPGDILVFLTGQEEIEAAQQNIEDTARKIGSRAPELIVAPIYSALPSDLQQKIFQVTPPGARKVVLATNIAETSLTIDGIVYVIDPGFAKENNYNAQTGMESLIDQPISRASANQRAGRAGRTGPGKCFRLYTKWSYFNELNASTEPEIQRTNMCGTILLLLSLNITNILQFDFMDSPPASTVIASLELLYGLGALNDKGALTKIGRQLSQFPINPMEARAILAAEKYGCVEEVLSIIAMLGESAALFYRPKDQKVAADHARSRFTDKQGGDHLTLLRIWNEWVDSDYSIAFCKENFLQNKSLNRARDVREQLQGLCDRVEITKSSIGASDHVSIRKALMTGFFPNTARLQRDGQSYQVVNSKAQAFIHPSSTMLEQRPKWVIYHQMVLTSKEYMRQVFPIDDPEWLMEVAPHVYKREDLDKLGMNKKMPKVKGK